MLHNTVLTYRKRLPSGKDTGLPTLDIREYMQSLPEMDRFLTVDELNADFEAIAAEFPEMATLERVGTSTLGEPISMLTIGNGSKQALLFACPHPNEPIGAMLVHHFARMLTQDETLRDGLGYTWNLISCVDPDGTRLNENWFAGPFTVTNYARNFYRPAGHQQVEWTFPSFYKQNYFDRSISETEMLMRVIDRLQPTLMGSLHNAGFGGVYYYISHDRPELYDTLHTMPGWEELPLRLGEGEASYAVEFAPAIYKLLSSRDAYDHMETNGADMSTFSHGGSSFEYAEKYDTFTFVTEMAYFDDPRVNDTTVTETTRREAILKDLDNSEADYGVVTRTLDAVKDDLKTDSLFQDAISSFAHMHAESLSAERTWAESDPSTERMATVAELFSSNQEGRFYRLLVLGMLLRMLEGEINVGNGTPKIRNGYKEALAAFTESSSQLESELNYRAVPIRKLVAVQLGSVLASAQLLADSSH